MFTHVASELGHVAAPNALLSADRIADRRVLPRVTGELLGCHVVAETGDMIHEAVAIMAGHVPAAVAVRAMHAHPTLSELMRTALSQAAG